MIIYCLQNADSSATIGIANPPLKAFREGNKLVRRPCCNTRSMFAVSAQPRWQELAGERAELERRLEVHRGAYAAKQAQLAELSVVRARNLAKVLSKLEREERQVAARSDTLADKFREFQKARDAHRGAIEGNSFAQRQLASLQSGYYRKMQAMLPAWEEHKTKLKLQYLADLQVKKHELEKAARVAVITNHNEELDARIAQASLINRRLEQELVRRALSKRSASERRHMPSLISRRHSSDRSISLWLRIRFRLPLEQTPPVAQTRASSTGSVSLSTTSAAMHHRLQPRPLL